MEDRCGREMAENGLRDDMRIMKIWIYVIRLLSLGDVDLHFRSLGTYMSHLDKLRNLYMHFHSLGT